MFNWGFECSSFNAALVNFTSATYLSSPAATAQRSPADIHTHLVDYVVENRKGHGAQCTQNLLSGTFYFAAPSWRWWREINKVITVMEMCVFCDDSWARGRCDHMMHRDWVSGRTWTVTTGQSRRVFFEVSETHLGKNINQKLQTMCKIVRLMMPHYIVGLRKISFPSWIFSCTQSSCLLR